MIVWPSTAGGGLGFLVCEATVHRPPRFSTPFDRYFPPGGRSDRGSHFIRGAPPLHRAVAAGDVEGGRGLPIKWLAASRGPSRERPTGRPPAGRRGARE